MQNYKMIIAYDGRRYKGFRATKTSGDKSIQYKLEAILEKLYEGKVEVISAVSTDAGVHAKHQVVNFLAPDNRRDADGIWNYVETYLPDDVICISVEAADERFHSRYQAKFITYEYRIWKKNAPSRALFERQYVNAVKEELDVKLMKDAAKLFLGEHDFTAFSAKSKVKSPVKTIDFIDVEETEDEVIITISATGYLINMERIIVGTLIQVGSGQRHMDNINRAFKTRDSKDVGHKAMGHALCLVDVVYET